MGDEWQDVPEEKPTPYSLRPAKPGEKSFYGGPLCGSFDFTAEDDDELEWVYYNGDPRVYVYERDVTGRMVYRGLKRPDYPGASE